VLLIQILVILFSFFAITRTLSRFRKGNIGLNEVVVWCLFWVIVGIVVLVPSLTQWFADLLGVGRGADAVFYVSLIALFYVVFRLHLKSRNLDQQITQLVRKLALERAYRDSKDK